MKFITPKLSWQYALREAVLILVLSYFLLLTGTTPLLLEKNIWLMTAALLAGLALLWLAAGQRATTPLARPLTFFLLVFALSTALSMDPRRSLTQLAFTLAGAFLFALSAEVVARGWTADLVVKCLLIAAFIEVGVILVPAVGWYFRWLQAEPGRWLPTITYRPALANILVMFANVLLLVTAARLWYAQKGAGRWMHAALALLRAVVIFLTSSRGGWLGTAAGAFLLFFLVFRQSGFRLAGLREVAARRPALAVAVGMLGLALLAGGGWLALRQLAHPTHGSFLLSRSEYWPAAWKTFLAHPLFGQGPYTYASSFLAENSVPPKYLFVHGHSVILNTLAERGLVGLLSFGMLVYFLARDLLCRWQQARGAERALPAGALAAMAAVGVQSLFDCFHTDPLGILPLIVVLGASLARPAASPAKSTRPWWVLIGVGLIAFEVWTVLPLYSGVEAANRSDHPAAKAALTAAVRRDPASAVNHQQLALVVSLRAAGGDLQDLDRAITEMRQTIQLEPAWALNHANLGALLAQQDDLDGAQQAFEQAAARAPRWVLPYLNLGLLAEQRGDPAAALNAYRQALAVSVEARESTFWQSSPLRVQALAAAPASAGSATPTLAELRRQAAAYPQTTRPYLLLAQAEIQSGNYAAALHPLDLAALTWISEADRIEQNWLRAESLAGQGRPGEAIDSGYQVLQSYLFAGLFGPGTFGQLRYAPFMFRRPAMALEIVPQLATLPLSSRWEARTRLLEGWMRADGRGDQADAVSSLREAHLRILFPGQTR